MVINIIKNMEKAPYMGSEFGQDVEPSGTYVLEKDTEGPVIKPWVEGRAEIKNPLIIDVDDDTLISYKYDLAKKYKAKGKTLTKKLMDKGYDALITMRNGESGEIVLFPNCNFSLELNETIRGLLRKHLLESVKGGQYEAYHGSDAKITSFVDEFVGGSEASDLEWPGIYFSSDKDEASHYGEFLYSVVLEPRLLFDESPTNPRKLKPILSKLIKMAPDWKETAQNWDENAHRGLNLAIESFLDYNDNEKDCLLQVWIDFYRHYPVEYVRNCVKLGIDGIAVGKNKKLGTTHYIIYNPSIIKKM